MGICRYQADVYNLNQATEVPVCSSSMLGSASQHLRNKQTVVQDRRDKKHGVMKTSQRKEKA